MPCGNQSNAQTFDSEQYAINAFVLQSWFQSGRYCMSALVIHQGEWVVVCDGAKALILENTGDSKFPNLKTIEVFEHKSLATHELGTDAPGRSHSSVGHGRSAVQQTDWHDQEEREFLVKLVKHLDTEVTAGKTKSLIVVAPPRALGVIRDAYPHGLRAAVRAEIDKDYVKLPVYEIEKHLTGA
jgi:protein required for attachment to host cells